MYFQKNTILLYRWVVWQQYLIKIWFFYYNIFNDFISFWCADIKNKILKTKYIILIYLRVKNIFLKNIIESWHVKYFVLHNKNKIKKIS